MQGNVAYFKDFREFYVYTFYVDNTYAAKISVDFMHEMNMNVVEIPSQNIAHTSHSQNRYYSSHTYSISSPNIISGSNIGISSNTNPFRFG